MNGSLLRSRRPGRSAHWWALGGVTMVCGLLLAAPGALGLTYTAPYSHVTQTKFDWLRAMTGCAQARSGTPTFAPSTGVAAWSGRASTVSCGAYGKTITDDLAEAEGATELAVPVQVPTGSATHATFNVTWDVTAAGAIGGLLTSRCIDPLPANTSGTYECTAAAFSSLIGGAWLVDLTNGTVTIASNMPIVSGVGNETLNYTSCTPNCTSFAFSFKSGAAFSGAQTDSFTINATTNHAHRYAIVTYVGGWAAAELVGYTGHETAFVNMATLGNSARLASIVVT